MKTKYIVAVQEMYQDYFSLAVPEELIVKILKENHDMYEEVADGCVRDTFVRDIMSDLLMEEIGMTQYPCYGDNPDYKKKFFDMLPIACSSYGIEVL